MNMKTLFKYILAAALVLSFAACQEEPYAPGEPDPLDCHGIFFPQEQAMAYEVAPNGAKYLTFTVERELDAFEAFVPYEIVSEEEGFFELENELGNSECIYFDADQKEATFKVYYSEDFETGKKYTCTIRVTDPQYVSQYGLSSNELTFSLTVVEWELLGEGLWRDDLYTSFCQDVMQYEIAVPYHEKKVNIYQREDLPGYYRVDEVYTSDYVSHMTDGSDKYIDSYKDLCPGGSIYVNASDPAKVYIDAQLAFNHASYGGIYIASLVPEIFPVEGGDNYGVLKDGSITFPKSGLVAYVPSVGAFAYANVSGKHRIVLPGYRGYDYSVSVETSPAVKGKMPVTFTLGEDVAKVAYKVYDGHLTEVDMVSKLEDVKSGEGVQTVTESGVYDFSTENTGLYTIVACSYDKNDIYKEYAYVKFGYDTADDPREVDVHMGLIVSDKYAGAGLTKENSMEFYVYGTDLTEVKYALYRKANYDDFRESIELEFEMYAPAIGRDELALVNGIGYTGVLGGMSAGTEYILMVYADNGYHAGIYTVSASTEGTYNVLDTDFTVYDMPSRLQTGKDAYFKDWDVWSVNIGSGDEEVVWERTKRCTASISEDSDLMYDKNGNLTDNPDKAETVFDMVKVNGMHPNAAKKYGFKDEIQFNYYDGFVYTMRAGIDPCKFEGKTIYPTSAYWYLYDNMLYTYWEDGAMIGGFVSEAQDVIAFVSNPATEVGSAGLSYAAMLIGYFENDKYDDNGTVLPKVIYEDAHVYPLLISPDADIAEPEAAALKAPESCRIVSGELAKTRRNHVETADGYIMSTIDRVKNAPYNYMMNIVEGISESAESSAVEFTMTKSSEHAASTKAAGFHKAVLR